MLGSFLIDRGAVPALAGQELYCISQQKMPHVTQLTVLRPEEGHVHIKGWLRPKQGMHMLLTDGPHFAGEQDYRSSGVHGLHRQTCYVWCAAVNFTYKRLLPKATL